MGTIPKLCVQQDLSDEDFFVNGDKIHITIKSIIIEMKPHKQLLIYEITIFSIPHVVLFH